MTILIDLIWWNFGNIGGVETYLKNLLAGIHQKGETHHRFILLAANDNYEKIQALDLPENSLIEQFPVSSKNKLGVFLYQYFFINRIARKLAADLLFVPTPIFPVRKSSMKTVVTMHDLQFMHYPQYASLIYRSLYKLCWSQITKNATAVVAISDYVADDIRVHYPRAKGKVRTIYNPVVIQDTFDDFGEVENAYGIKERSFFYTVSSLLPHKHTEILLHIIREIKARKLQDIPSTLVISGIGKNSERLKKLIQDLDIEENVIITGYVTDERRNSLYKMAAVFLFPSMFEGFGMPPVEAMISGTPVITTTFPAIVEVTKGLCSYVNDQSSIEEWIDTIYTCIKGRREGTQFPEYSLDTVVDEYLDTFRTV